MIEHVPRTAYPQPPLTNAQRIANWQALYRYFANEYAAEQAATAEPVDPEYSN